ncbi:MAG: hypothetical protein IJ514_07345 [Clostridia bacterium]|nr:hypothetical protein [Clostridia bacterium]
MNEEIEYAEMLEIPVSTVNVVRKKRAKKRRVEAPAPVAAAPQTERSDLKESVIAQVNDKLLDTQTEAEKITAEAALFAESANSEGSLDFGEIPDRIDTVRLYSENERPFLKNDLYLEPQDYALEDGNLEEDEGRYERRETAKERRTRLILGAEFIAACALCGTIFLTNVFMPNSAINTFFRALGSEPVAAQTDDRTYTDFTLSRVVSDLSDTELTLSPTGILSFTDECCVYPVSDGTVSAADQNADGTYTLKIAYSDTFTGVFSGLDHVYYAVGDEVKANIPVGFSEGETEVQVTMYSSGELLNCFELTEENCLAWVAE